MANSTAELGLLKDILYPLLYARLYPTKSKKSGRQKPSPPPEGEEVSYPEVEEFADVNSRLFKLERSSTQANSEQYFSTTLLPTLPPPSTLAAPSFEADTLSPPPELLETLITYSLIPDPASAEVFVEDLIGEYVKVVRAEAERAGSVEEVGVLRAAPGGKKECEICEREVPLSFHHLIPVWLILRKRDLENEG